MANRYYWQVLKYSPGSNDIFTDFAYATELGTDGKISTGSAAFSISQNSNIRQLKLINGDLAYSFSDTASTGTNLTLEFSPLSTDLSLFQGFKDLQQLKVKIRVLFHYDNQNVEYPAGYTGTKWDYYTGYIQNVSLNLILGGKNQLYSLRINLLPEK